MAPIAAETSFRTLCIPASLHHPTITLCPLPVTFTQPATLPDVDAVDNGPNGLLPPARRPPSPPPFHPEDHRLLATL
eukprot:scaffold34833_cov336-Amphora_coffeaeformis.AAC.1